MDETKLSPDRLEVVQKIKEYEKKGWFDKDVENDPPAPELLPDKVDYLNKKLSSKIATWWANRRADRFFLKMIKKGQVLVEEPQGLENLEALKNGAVITCNHFAIPDNYIIFHCIRKYLPRKYLYKVIREGNYTNFPGFLGFILRNCNTLPLSSNRRTMVNFMSACNTLLTRGDTILIYPEQGMWWNYRKPRPFKIGGFKIAYRANVPVIPMFITMEDSDVIGPDGCPLQRHTLHIMPAVYPDGTLNEKLGAEKMRDEAYAACKAKYEEVYGVPLVYATETDGEVQAASETNAETAAE